MDRLAVEALSRSVPYSQAEIEWAMCRPAGARTPTPAVGDTVLVRLDHWADPVEATVLRVQPVDDVDDPHLARVAMDGRGEVVLIEGRPVMELANDPWVTLWLSTPDGMANTHTREARLRGSPGWLPPDWKTRTRPIPAAFEPLVEN